MIFAYVLCNVTVSAPGGEHGCMQRVNKGRVQCLPAWKCDFASGKRSIFQNSSTKIKRGPFSLRVPEYFPKFPNFSKFQYLPEFSGVFVFQILSIFWIFLPKLSEVSLVFFWILRILPKVFRCNSISSHLPLSVGQWVNQIGDSYRISELCELVFFFLQISPCIFPNILESFNFFKLLNLWSILPDSYYTVLPGGILSYILLYTCLYLGFCETQPSFSKAE